MTDKRYRVIRIGRTVLVLAAVACSFAVATRPASAGNDAKVVLNRIGIHRGICVVVGLPEGKGATPIIDLARASELIVYFQSAAPGEVLAVRKAAEAAGLLGTRVFADCGAPGSIQLADNLAGAVWVAAKANDAFGENELLRVLHPQGRAILGDKTVVKPFPEGIDSWSHPYHGPDNNPQSTDRVARWPYLTQFLAEPMFVPMPEISVAARGKVFRAFGHIAHKANQNQWLNTLVCINGFNGTILWKRPLHEGFMIHRNTMIATPETLYLADDQSCKMIDPDTGKVRAEIVIPEGIADGAVWKWMALEDGVLYALIGGPETKAPTQRSQTPGLGHWPWGMWPGHDYKDPKTNFGFGRTFVAVDPKTRKVLWSHSEKEYLDSRGVCMKGGRIYFYAPEKLLGCLGVKKREVLWRTSAPDLLRAIGPNGRAQLWVTGYSTTTYIKCNDKYVFFAGPQRSRLVVVSAKDGKLLWQKEGGNYQLVLRDDGFYAAGPLQRPDRPTKTGGPGFKLAYETGKVLAPLPVPGRRACTRATGSIDSIFFRAPGGTVRIDTATGRAQHIAPMRPPCHDGVIISDGLLYWGPWMCGCQLSLYGHIGLAPAGEFNFHPGLDSSRLRPGQGDTASVEPLEVEPGDWPCYLGDNRRTATAKASVPRNPTRRWTYVPESPAMPTAPVAVGNWVFVADRAGVVRALGADGKLRWKAYTGGAIYFPPAVYEGRLYVGSADGRVYALEATTGRKLWSFRVAPAEQRIAVYGKLISRWPVAGGVVAHRGLVYAAAGITHYDGTHVVALDAVTGKVRWYNDSSGTLSAKAHSGVSLQGSLFVEDGELRFVGGGVHKIARYDLATGKCLNAPHDAVNSQYHSAFYAYYPQYGKYLSLNHTFPDGRTLVYDASYEGSRHSKLSLMAPLPPGASKPSKSASRRGYARRGQPRAKFLWVEPSGRRFNSFVVTGDVLLTAGQTGAGDDRHTFLALVRTADGKDVWYRKLPVAAVKGGTAIDRSGRIVVSLENGQVLCFAAAP